MSLLNRAARAGLTRRGITEAQVLTQMRRGTGSTAGQLVTNDTANALMAVWRCKHLLADIVAGLPYPQYRNLPDGTRERMDPAEIVRQPSDFVDAVDWRYQLVLSALDAGNGYGVITDVTTSGYPRRSEIVDPCDMKVRRANGALAPVEYKLKGRPLDPDLVKHLRAFGPAPGSVLGMAPLEYARQTIGLGLAVRSYGADWYASGGHPTAILSNPKVVSPTSATEAKERFREATMGDHLAALGDGWKYESVQVAPDQALFLAAINATAVDVCGYFGVPPEMLGLAVSGSSVTYANREQRALDLLVYTVQWWIGRVERLISSMLPPGQYVKANLDALLRTDTLTRYKAHDMALRDGWRNRDEVRRIEDEAPLPDGQGTEYLWPPYRAFPIDADAVPADAPAQSPAAGGGTA